MTWEEHEHAGFATLVLEPIGHQALCAIGAARGGRGAGAVQYRDRCSLAAVEHRDRGLIGIEQREWLAGGVGMDPPREAGQILPAIDDRQHYERCKA